jgi:hypothetical protein
MSSLPISDPQQPPSISISDLQNLLIVIDLATTRGAFRGPELSQVGQVFDKLNQFLQSVAPTADPATQQPTPPAPVPPAPQPVVATTQPVMQMTPPFTPKVGI